MRLATIGKSVTRIDAPSKVTGQARYAEDWWEHGTLYARILRSPHPHARIVSIDISKALQLPGVRAVITGNDMPDRRMGILVLDQYPLARDIVRYVGEPVAAVAADSPDTAEDALALIEVIYETEQAVFDIESAMSANCRVIIHPDLGKHSKLSVTGIRPPAAGKGNVFLEWHIRNGNLDQGFKDAELIVENRYTVHRINHACIETHMASACIDPDGVLTIRSTRQGPGIGKPHACRFFDLPASRVRMMEPYIGGSFGGKADLWIELIAARLAQITKRPVRLTLTRKEVFETVSRSNFVIYVKDGVKKDGTLIARDIRFIVGSGAYSQMSSAIVRNAGFAAVGTYRTPNFHWASYGVYTNLPPSTAFRGFGAPEVQWAIEQQMDVIAEKLRLQPVEVRQRNLLHKGDVNVQGQMTTGIGAEECLSRVEEWLGSQPIEKKTGPWCRGRGIAVGNKYTVAATTSCVNVKVHPENRLEVCHGLDEIGQGINTVAAQVVAEEFGVAFEDVDVRWGDTMTMPYDWASMASRSTWQLGHAARLACKDAKRRLFEMAGQKLGAHPDDLETSGWKVFVNKCPYRSIPIRELFSPVGIVPGVGEIFGQGEYTEPKIMEDPETGQSPKAATTYMYGACGVEIAVNEETGEIRIERLVTAYDMGQPINPRMCEQQIEGGVTQAIGGLLYEELLTEEGVVKNSNFLDYKISGTMETPNLAKMCSILAPDPDERGPFGAKALGEGVLTPIAPAIGTAFYNATGLRVTDQPLTRERVWRLLKERKK